MNIQKYSWRAKIIDKDIEGKMRENTKNVEDDNLRKTW